MSFSAIINHRGNWYLGAGVLLGAVGFLVGGVVFKILLLWSGACCVYLGIAYLLSRNGMLLKSQEGRIPLVVKILLLPFFLASYFYNWQARLRDNSDPFHQIKPRLYLGRRLLASDQDLLKELGINSILDTTVEYESLRWSIPEHRMEYKNLPVFDHGVPTLDKLHEAVLWIDEQIQGGRTVVVHCALGRGRSSTALLAYLIYKDPDAPIESLLEHTRSIRKVVSPNARQLATLQAYRQSGYIQTREKAMLVYNPTAGNGDHDKDILHARSLLGKKFDLQVEATSEESDSAKRLVRQALDDDCKLIIAGGGDGTVSDIASELVGSDATMAVLPLGTANAFASCLYGEAAFKDIVRDACEHILHGETQTIDIARVNGAIMIQMVGIGFEKKMIEQAEGDHKKQWGVLGYVLGGFKALREAPQLQVRLEADGKAHEFKSQCVAIANLAPFFSITAQGGGNPVGTDGKLDLTWLEPASTSAKVGSMFDLLHSGITDTQAGSGVHHLAFRRAKLTTTPETKVSVDGDISISTPLQIEVIPKALRVRK